jgi:hypothetical protein
MYPMWEEGDRTISVSNDIDFIQKIVSAISLLFDSRRGELGILFWVHRRICFMNLCFVIFSTLLFYSLLNPILLSQFLLSSLVLTLCPPSKVFPPPASLFSHFSPYFVSLIPSIVIPYLFVALAWGSYHHTIIPSYPRPFDHNSVQFSPVVINLRLSNSSVKR